MKIIEDKNLINFNEEKTINFILHNIKYNLSAHSVSDDNVPFFNHVLIHKDTNEITSEYAYFFMSLFYRFCNKHNYLITKFLRMCINITSSCTSKTKQHLDHEGKEHFQSILYLNDIDGSTDIFTKEGVCSIIPEKNKFILFDNVLHKANPPSNNLRKIVVCTFEGKNGNR